MSPKNLSVAGLVIGAAAILAGCATAAPAEAPPALIKPVAGSQIPHGGSAGARSHPVLGRGL